MARKNLLKGFKKPKRVEFEATVADAWYGKFTAFPFETGFGTTIGNCLRRVLLSSIQGYAITAVRIISYDSDGGSHNISSEFEAVPHVREDTLEILNNLKQIRLVLDSSDEEATFNFEFKGPAKITGKDFMVGNQLEIFSEDLHIMEMMEGSHVELEIQVKSGRGYVPAETNEQYVDVVGTIPVDAIFSPVTKVRYEIQPCRVGQRNDYDKLVLEVWTDGTVKPVDAVAEAAKIAKEHFSVFINFDENECIGDDSDEDDSQINELLNTKIAEIDFSVRARNCLLSLGVQTLGDLTKLSDQTLASARNVGKKSLSEIQGKLQEYNLHLGMTDYSHLKEVNKLARQKEETDEA